MTGQDRARGRTPTARTSLLRTITRITLGAAMVGAGIGHLTTQRLEFQAQVPNWFPLDEDLTVVGSGVVEIALGATFVALPRHKRLVGGLLAAFFVVILPRQHRAVCRGHERLRAGHGPQAAGAVVLPTRAGAGGALRRWLAVPEARPRRPVTTWAQVESCCPWMGENACRSRGTGMSS